MSEDMENEFMKRGYLLSEGCKDLTDVAKIRATTEAMGGKFAWFRKILKLMPPQNLVEGTLTISEKISMSELATMLDKEPSPIIAKMMMLGIFPHEILDFETASEIAQKYGFVAIKAK